VQRVNIVDDEICGATDLAVARFAASFADGIGSHV
jgi:hypothetical protein